MSLVRVFSFILLALWVVADQALKLYTVNTLDFQGQTQTVVPGFLAFYYTLNKGAAWSLFWGQLGFLTALRFTVAIALTVYLLRKSVTGWSRIAFAMIAGGAFGNAIDGLLREGVVDMLILWPLDTVYRAITGSPYPIFNIADIGVVGGALLLVFLSFVTPKKAEAVHDAEERPRDAVYYPARASQPGETSSETDVRVDPNSDLAQFDAAPNSDTASKVPKPQAPSVNVPNKE